MAHTDTVPKNNECHYHAVAVVSINRPFANTCYHPHRVYSQWHTVIAENELPLEWYYYFIIDGDCIEGHNHNILSCGPCCDLPAHSFHLPDRLW